MLCDSLNNTDASNRTFTGLAMRMCIELGLHRQKRSSKVSLRSELNKRLFWSCYWWDREIAIALGRPPSISDHDIDVEVRCSFVCPLRSLTDPNQLPSDVEEANQDVEVLRMAANADKSAPAYPRTTMSTFIHLLRLKIIESDIQHNVYRVDRPSVSKAIHQLTDTFLERLYAWRDAIPPQSKEWGPADRHKFRGDEYMSYDSYVGSNKKSPNTGIE